jgi:hypothetical protein
MPRPSLPPHLRRSCVVRLGFTPPEVADLQRRASTAGTSVEDFVRQAALAGCAAPEAQPAPAAQPAPEAPAGLARAIIAGGRHYALTDADRAALDDLHATLTIAEVVSGGADGADAGGERWAKDRGIPILRFPADWDRHGKAAGPLRNAAMADYLAESAAQRVCILFPGGNGTASMRAEAVKRGIRVIELGTAEAAPIAASPVSQAPCPKCNGTGRTGTRPVLFRCPACAARPPANFR